jgi:hypothetical protein
MINTKTNKKGKSLHRLPYPLQLQVKFDNMNITQYNSRCLYTTFINMSDCNATYFDPTYGSSLGLYKRIREKVTFTHYRMRYLLRWCPIVFDQASVYFTFWTMQLYTSCIIIFIQFKYMLWLSISAIIKKKYWLTNTGLHTPCINHWT